MDRHQEKEQLRSELLKRREKIGAEEFKRNSSEIVARLQTLPVMQQARTIHCYISMNERREVNTHGLIRWLLASNKRVVVPITDFKTTSLINVELNSFGELSKNKWGVLEPPENNRRIPPAQFDLIIVPMVGADAQCNRIGYGKGFYDRFLQNVEATSVGLCFQHCKVDEIPVEPFDVSLSAVVTEQQIYSCK